MLAHRLVHLAFCSISALDRPIEAVAQLAARCGVDGIEITAHPPHLDPEEDPDVARHSARAVRSAGLEVVAYGSYLGRFGRVTPAHAHRDAAIAAALEAPLWRVWAEPIPDGNPDMTPAVTLLQTACDAAAPHGIVVVVERHIGSFADTPERIARLFAAIDRPNVALNYQVLDFLPPDAVSRQAADAAQLVPLARYFHLKNYQPNPGGDGPLFPGGSLRNGVLDYTAILRAALGAGYAGPLTIEFLAADERDIADKLADDVRFVRDVLRQVGG